MADDELVRDPELEDQAARELRARRLAQPVRPYIPAVSSTLPEASVPMGRYTGATEMPRTSSAGAGPAAPADWPGAAGAPPDILQPQTGAMPRIATPRLTKPEAPVGTEQDLLNQIQDMRYKREHPMGTLGTPSGYSGVGGKILHGLAKAGNIAGQAIVPNLMPTIPGTDVYNREKEANLRNALERQRAATSQENLASARAEWERAEAEGKRHPLPKPATGEKSTWQPDESEQDQRSWQLYDYPTGQNWVPLGDNPASYDPAVVGPSYPGIGPARGMPTTGAAAPMGAPPVGPGTIPGITQLPPTPLAPTATAQRPTGTFGIQKPDDETRFIRQWLKDNNAPNTAVNIEKARAAYKSGGPIGQEMADTYAAQIADLLKGTPAEAGGYQVTARSTDAEAKEALRAAREANSANRPYVNEKIKDRHTYGYAEDPNGTLMLTSKAQADEWGHQFMEVSKADQYKDVVAISQLNDIQQNTSRYRNAVAALRQPISTIHAQNMATILNDDKIKTGTTLGWLGRFDVPGGDFIAQILKDTDKAKLWNDGLTGPERDVLSAYIRAKSSAFMYQRAIGSVTRLPGELLKLELDNLPVPYVGWTASEPRFRDWQENIDRVTKRFPHNLPGAQHPAEVRKELERGAAPGAAPPRAPAAGGPRNFSEWKKQQAGAGGTP